MQFIEFSAFFLDGIAFATESVVGRAFGARNKQLVHVTTVRTTQWAAAIATLITLGLALGGGWAIDVLTVDRAVRAVARSYLPWAALAPLAGVWCFQLDGIFIGATRSVDMRHAMLISLLIFLGAWYALTPFGNHGLWAAFYVHYAARTLTLLAYYPRLLRAAVD